MRRTGLFASVLSLAVLIMSFHGAVKAQPSGGASSTITLAQLQQGGFVLLLRHTTSNGPERLALEGYTEPNSFDMTDCTVQLNLTEFGVAQAESLGSDIRDVGIPIGTVLASPYCRTLDTGRLAFGGATPDWALVPPAFEAFPGVAIPGSDERMAQLHGLLTAAPSPGTNTVLITHAPTIRAAVALEADQGEALIYQPDGNGGAELVGRVLFDEWSRFAPAGP